MRKQANPKRRLSRKWRQKQAHLKKERHRQTVLALRILRGAAPGKTVTPWASFTAATAQRIARAPGNKYRHFVDALRGHLAPNPRKHYADDDRTAKWIRSSKSRTTLIEWLGRMDRNGIWTDSDLEREGMSPMTLRQAKAQALCMLRSGGFACSCRTCSAKKRNPGRKTVARALRKARSYAAGGPHGGDSAAYQEKVARVLMALHSRGLTRQQLEVWGGRLRPWGWWNQRWKNPVRRKNPWGTFFGGMAAGAGMHVATRALNAVSQNGKRRAKRRLA